MFCVSVGMDVTPERMYLFPIGLLEVESDHNENQRISVNIVVTSEVVRNSWQDSHLHKHF